VIVGDDELAGHFPSMTIRARLGKLACCRKKSRE
jgi:hypothetical protein